MDGFKIGNENIKDTYCHCAYLIYMEYFMWNSGLDETLADVKIAGRNKKPQIYRWYHSNDRKWRGTLEPPNEVKEESEKGGLKLKIQKTKIMASGPITSWQVDRETMETVTDFMFGPPKSL